MIILGLTTVTAILGFIAWKLDTYCTEQEEKRNRRREEETIARLDQRDLGTEAYCLIEERLSLMQTSTGKVKAAGDYYSNGSEYTGPLPSLQDEKCTLICDAPLYAEKSWAKMIIKTENGGKLEARSPVLCRRFVTLWKEICREQEETSVRENERKIRDMLYNSEYKEKQ